MLRIMSCGGISTDLILPNGKGKENIMLGIIDYGAGNLFSIQNAFEFIGVDFIISSDKDTLSSCDRLMLPGVGAFRQAMDKLSSLRMDVFIKEQVSSGKPLIGVCLGAQMLFDESDEFGLTRGLSLIPGSVTRIAAPGLKVPHMGWNELVLQNPCPVLDGGGEFVYFVHSYKIDTADQYISAYCDYAQKIPAVVYRDNVYGCQFHPEKSGQPGLDILKRFAAL